MSLRLLCFHRSILLAEKPALIQPLFHKLYLFPKYGRFMASSQEARKEENPPKSPANVGDNKGSSAQSEDSKDGSEEVSRRELKRMKRAAQKEAWKARKRQKRSAVLEAGGSTKSKEPTLSGASLEETSYYIENGLRKVYPYYFTFQTFVKGRWYNRKLLDVLVDEFGEEQRDVYEKWINCGKTTINKQKVTTDYVIQQNDYLQSTMHRHEKPVSSEKIEIIAETSELFVINKPSSIPVHPVGKYRHNTLPYILAKEHGYRNIRGVHRLDRLTSGVIIYAKTQKKADEVTSLIANRTMEKEYLCRVEGEFPRETVTVDEPLAVLCPKIGLHLVKPDGKPAKTVFERLSYNGKSSVVKCKPLTGRTHQIRVHLQYLGHPIVNDDLYNTEVWGPEKGKRGRTGKTDDELVNAVRKHHFKDRRLYGGPVTDPRTIVHPEDSTFQMDKLTVDEDCPECKLNFIDPTPEENVLFLHAYSYKGPDFEFKSKIPDWAKEDWKE